MINQFEPKGTVAPLELVNPAAVLDRAEKFRMAATFSVLNKINGVNISPEASVSDLLILINKLGELVPSLEKIEKSISAEKPVPTKLGEVLRGIREDLSTIPNNPTLES